jgi:hypothetical protein
MNEELWESIDRELLSWPGVSREQGRFNSTAYMLGRREIGHIHRNGVADLPFPKAVYDELLAAGRAQPHQAGVRGFVSYQIDDLNDINQAIALFRMNYDRATAVLNRSDSEEEQGAA